MKIKKVAFGDFDESFVEDRFKNNVNIIFSDDNNKGKTLVFQGLMFSIGNDPIFPAGFPYQDCYFYSMLDFNGNQVEFLRKGREFVIKDSDEIRVFDSVSEFKYSLKQYFSEMPEISKKESLKLVDPCLFFELFFVGQDLRDPSSTFSKYYNKTDFINLIYALGGVGRQLLSSDEIKKLKDNLKSKSSKRGALKKELDRLNIDPEVSKTVLQSANNEEIKRREEALRKARSRVSELDRALSRETNRKYKLEALLLELNSLNRKIEVGSVKCGECGSDKIVYTSGEFEYDLTNSYVKKSIFSSIKDSIKLKDEIIDELVQDIGVEKRSLELEISSAPAELRDVILFRDQLSDGNKMDVEIAGLDSEIDDIQGQLSSESGDNVSDKKYQKSLIKKITSFMNKFGKDVDQSRAENYNDIFAAKGQTYSGSEQQIYYFCKVMALQKSFEHKYPIVIDAFREGEISSGKENLMLEKFSNIDNQVLISATLKEEEYSTEKYISTDNVNIIDYSKHIDNKILSEETADEFRDILLGFGITNPNAEH
ncbi:hypothetical protein OAE19_02775 [Porticoccaceae bacterium]|nr:hypothetical protein [Porticoccaceae bacterium]